MKNKVREKSKAKKSNPHAKAVPTSALVPQSSPQLPPADMPTADALAVVTRKMHPDMLGALGYTELARSMRVTGEHLEAACFAPMYLQEEMRAKNGIERMALTQMILAQGRTAWLSELSTRQSQPKSLAVVLEACERASSTFARLMRAFQEYRQQRNGGTKVSIGQANLTAQQLVQNIQKQNTQEKHDGQTRKGKEE